MKSHTYRTQFLQVAFLVVVASGITAFAEQQSGLKRPADSMKQSAVGMVQEKGISQKYCDDCECDNDIKFKKICTRILLSDCLDSDSVSARNLCAGALKSHTACIDTLNLNTNLCASQVDATTANLTNLNAQNVCVSGVLRANLANICNPDRATMYFSAPTLYTLGTTLPFDLIGDNPSGIASLLPDARFTVLKSGYYLITLHIDVTDFTPASGDPILGTPIGYLRIFVNGISTREQFTPYLTFNNQQDNLLTAIVSLNAGDVVTSRYQVLALDSATGLTSVPGTVTVIGTGAENEGLVKIILLSENCVPCQIIPPCVPPTPCDTTCIPCCDR